MKYNVCNKSKYQCSGCAACESVCPTTAITMREDDEGFLYPQADSQKCVECGKCLRVCAFTPEHDDLMPDREEKPLVYAVKHRDEAVRKNSRSGGAFTAFSDLTLQHNGSVYGCAMVSNTKARHIMTDTAEGRDTLRKSKYIQSDMSGVYDRIRQDLQAGKEVFFLERPVRSQR